MQVIGHRGAAALAPENTWIGFDRALALGVDAIETDVQATSDGVLVLIHDLRLDRTTDGQGLVAETPWSVVGGLDAGSWFDPQYSGARVPLLDETLARYGRRTHIALEIKQPGIEIEVLGRVKALGLLDAVTFTSFDFTSVERIRREEPAAYVGFLTSDISPASVAACPRYRPGPILPTGRAGDAGPGLGMESDGVERARLGRTHAGAHATRHRRRRRRHDRRLPGSAVAERWAGSKVHPETSSRLRVRPTDDAHVGRNAIPPGWARLSYGWSDSQSNLLPSSTCPRSFVHFVH